MSNIPTNNRKCEDKDNLQQSVRKAVNKLNMRMRELTTSKTFVNSSVANQNKLLSHLIGGTLGYEITPITADEMGAMFYATNVQPFVNSIVSALNEVAVIDVNSVLAITNATWLTRHYITIGRSTIFDSVEVIEKRTLTPDMVNWITKLREIK